MVRPAVSVICCLLLATLIFSCSTSKNENPVVPQDELRTAEEAVGGILLLGQWQVVIDPDTGTADIVPLRSADLILNVLGFLEPPTLQGLNISNLNIDSVAKTVEVDVIITHSIPNTKLKIFDTRGVVYGPEVANTDGYTILTSPEYFKDVPLGYIDGLLGTKDDVINYEGMAGFKYFADGLEATDNLVEFMAIPANAAMRGVFSEGPNSLTRHYVLDWNNVSYPFLAFNYSIYANWAKPDGDAPFEVADFPLTTANNQEAVCLTLTETENSLWYSGGSGGGTLSLQAEVWDWQGNAADVSIEAGSIIAPVSGIPAGPGTTAYSSLYNFSDIPVTLDSSDAFTLTVTVTDPVTYGEAWIGGLLPTDNPMYGEAISMIAMDTVTVSPIAVEQMDMIIDYRPFSIDPVSGLMNTDGLFDTGIGVQEIGLFVRNNGSVLVPGVEGELIFEPVSGIVPVESHYIFGDIPPGASVMGLFSADFSVTPPAKHVFTLSLNAPGFENSEITRNAFVATYQETGYGQFTNTIPQGTITTQWLNFTYGPELQNYSAPTSLMWTMDPVLPFPGQFSELPFEDPWWKAIGIGVVIGAGINMVIDGVVEACGSDYLDDAGEKINTGLAVAGGGAIAADVIDPFRRGEENTLPLPTEVTIQETVTMQATYDMPPVVGQPFTGTVQWEFTRITDGNSYQYSVIEPFINIHYNTDRQVQINQTEFVTGEVLVVTAALMGATEAYANTDAYMITSISRKMLEYQVVQVVALKMFDDGTHGDAAAEDGMYTGSMIVDEFLPPGDYTWGVFSQDVNQALEGMDPLTAAQNLGGFMIGAPMPGPIVPPTTCGLVNDGEFSVL